MLNEVLGSDCSSDGLYFFMHLVSFLGHDFSLHCTLHSLSLEKQSKSFPCHKIGLPFCILTLMKAFLLSRLRHAVSNLKKKKIILNGSEHFWLLGVKKALDILVNGMKHEDEIKQHHFPGHRKDSLYQQSLL